MRLVIPQRGTSGVGATSGDTCPQSLRHDAADGVQDRFVVKFEPGVSCQTTMSTLLGYSTGRSTRPRSHPLSKHSCAPNSMSFETPSRKECE
jgi:hypothetical protein